jgi:hypothetical protein
MNIPAWAYISATSPLLFTFHFNPSSSRHYQVGDAYIVVGGIAHQAAPESPGVVTHASQRVDLARSRALLDRMFALAYSMQV